MAGEIVVVTGASAGVGRATAVEFARGGAAKVALLARGRDGLDGARRDVEAAGAQALPLEVDVADADGVDRAADAVEQQLGAIDIWVNNAMATVFSRFLEVTPDEFRRATEVTYLGYVWGTLAALRRMRGRNRGTIVQVGSALAYRGIPLQAAYCGAKHAVQGFSESVRCELIHDRIDVHLTMVQLPALNTPQFDWGRAKMPKAPRPVPPIFQPEVAAEAIVWAARNRRRELDVGFSTVKAILADKAAPQLVDLYVGRTGLTAQQTDEPLDRGRPDNLFEPVAGDHGAHGRFDDESCDRSIQLMWTVHRDSAIALAGLGLVARAARRLRR